ncbi:hypothetical protein BDU57DRAFT_598800 [Ampelomyces quisqualis]|uniref:Uncharacterized protein n=1 Tax=Ampelomyces quisqualis TaxID=50730 RepID=A0A6A5Q7N1_AMPQU|nr:hypothetical protein BDU57DRAFT_598800 [Ampelomyces quisqualis]
MKTFGLYPTVMVVALFFSEVTAIPIIRPRASGWDLATELIKLFAEILPIAMKAFPKDADAWNFQRNPNMCEIEMETTDGANCYVSVRCNDGLRKYNEGKATWNACYKGGRQYFNDPRIGDFSVNFTDTDGIDGQGLTSPVLQVKDIGDWKAIPVTDLAFLKQQDEDCEARNGANCGTGPYICTWLHFYHEDGRTRRWKCGVPKRGLNFPGLDSNAPTNERGYRPGWCGVHVTQYQKPDPSKDQYRLSAKLIDQNQNEIGNTADVIEPKVELSSRLPLPFFVKSRAVDSDPLDFEYDGVKWDSNNKNNHFCSVGAYDSGKREIDCGFTCN